MDELKNIAETLAEELPKPVVLHTQVLKDEPEAVLHLAIPNNFKHITVDTEKLLPNPRRTLATATMSEPADFIQYVNTHRKDSTVVWINFDPVTFALSFRAVIDDHHPDVAGWRQHVVSYKPETAIEWKTWTGHDKKQMDQATFAAFLENQEDDIAIFEGFPTHADMLKMALEFEARQDQSLKSAVRLQSGGVELNYIANDDAQTIEKMKMFDRFKIGIPVFRGVKDEMGKNLGYLLEARLRYRAGQGKVTFWYELVRPDKTHELASQELIRRIKEGVNSVPVYMGACGTPQ